ncbi:MAG: DUF721 domain-containing protein [Desulfobacterales bacterium]
MASGKPAGKDFTPIADLLTEVLSQCRKGNARGIEILTALWPQAVGAAVAANTRPAAVCKQMLLVHVSSSAWIQELHFQKQEILRKLNHAAGYPIISDIAFKVGPLHSSGASTEPPSGRSRR